MFPKADLLPSDVANLLKDLIFSQKHNALDRVIRPEMKYHFLKFIGEALSNLF